MLKAKKRMKVLVATEKPFAKVAVDGIREVVEKNGHTLALLEKYTDVNDFYEAVEALVQCMQDFEKAHK